ncbi:putative RNA polymerase sigma-70 region 2, RNA polymerase sigma factor, region 2 [Helianthus annuus]|nr:putative RNA polymerase sigma-70 region 2, RNA polymerase sigma factor, region 2 [Helianthus annuus]
MIRSNIRLVYIGRKKLLWNKGPSSGYCSGRNPSLVKSAEKFDASKGFKFSTYAHWWIRQAVQRSRAEQSRIIHVPYYMVEVQSKVNEAKHRWIRSLEENLLVRKSQSIRAFP